MGQLGKVSSNHMTSGFVDAARDDNLWELTEECGKLGYTAFLGPPTTVCLNLSCNMHPLSSYTRLQQRSHCMTLVDHVQHQKLACAALIAERTTTIRCLATRH